MMRRLERITAFIIAVFIWAVVIGLSGLLGYDVIRSIFNITSTFVGRVESLFNWLF